VSRYRKVSIHIWNDRKFRDLSDDGKLIFLFILTHPSMTSLGAMRSTPEGLAAEIHWTFERLSKAFREGLSESGKGLLKYDEKATCIFLPNFLKHNPPENPNVVKSWGKVLDLIPESPLKYEAISKAKSLCDTLSEPFQRAFESLLKGLGHTFRIPEPLPEPLPDNDTDIDSSKEESGPPRGRSGRSNNHFSNHAGEHFKAIKTACQSITALPKKNGGRPFNPYQWVQKQINEQKHPGAIAQVLTDISKPKTWGGIRDGPWAYANAIMKSVNQNWNEKEAIAIHEKFKSMSVKELSGITHGVLKSI